MRRAILNDATKEAVTAIFARALETLGVADAAVVLERPKDPTHGDIACTCAMQLARRLKQNPRSIAARIVEEIQKDPASDGLISSIEIAGPGFINLRIAQSARTNVVREVLRAGEAYGRSNAHSGESVLLEYVSANPTGPLHLGHARQGALGDVLANLLASQGWNVTREFYYNDAGVQIHNLAVSVQVRCRQILGEEIELPESAYHGEYIVSIAQDYLDRKPVAPHAGGLVESNGDWQDLEQIRRYAVAYLRNEQDDDLSALGVRFDNFFLESSLYTDGAVQRAAFSVAETVIVGDVPGTYTYFVPDVAYHLNKFSRGYSKAVNIQGSDHHGTMARVRAGLQAAAQTLGLHIPTKFPEYILHKMLAVIMDGEPVKMSKRAGNYVTLRDLVQWAGRDAARYFLVSRKADAEFVFDVTLARQKSDENPVYYLQYAHARICSVFAGAKEKGFDVPSTECLAEVPLDSLSSEEANQLIAKIAEYPELLAQAARDHAPHLLCYYLKDLAAAFHTFYNSERFLVEDPTLRNARLALVAAARQVLRNGLALLGISAPDYMSRKDEEEADAATEN